MKKKYTKIEIELVNANPCDVLTASPVTFGGYTESYGGDLYDWSDLAQ